MSVHLIYYKDGKKMMMPVLSKEEYMAIRNGGEQRERVKRIRSGEESLKHKLAQMNYSCLPNEDGTLKGSTRMSNTVGMDIDHIPAEELQAVKERILGKKEELGLLMLEESARGEGLHLVFKRRADLDQEGNLKWASELLNVAYDAQAKDITRVFFTTTAAELLYISDDLFDPSPSSTVANGDSLPFVGPKAHSVLSLKTPAAPEGEGSLKSNSQLSQINCQLSTVNCQLKFRGIPYSEIIQDYWNRTGGEPQEGERNVKLHKLAVNLRAICDNKKEVLMQVMPRYGLSETEMATIIDSACKEPPKGISKVIQAILDTLLPREETEKGSLLPREETEEGSDSSFFTLHSSFKKLPQGVKESIDAVGPQLAMPVVTAICPCIGTLATGVTLDVHGQKKGLNLISYIAGDFASGKGSIDPVVEAWMSEVQALDKMYQQQEDEWRAKKRAAKNKKEQPEEPKLPVRCLTLNNTVANLAERLANTEGKHAFSFTPEADTVAQKWKSTMSDFSVMLRQSYDGTRYEREARSADAVNVHIEKLLWNVCMCGTPDALYRVVSNYTDGFQSRIAVARTPDNTFAPLEDNPHVLTDRQRDRIQQIAHLLPLMHGEVMLPKLEAKGREWLERIRLETMKNDDRTRARQRFRICVTAQRMVCCLMLCKVCEMLIQKHGLTGAEAKLKQQPNLWKEMLLKAQTPTMLEVYDVIADSLLENALYFFRDRIENAFQSRDYAGGLNGERQKRGKNDSIFERLDIQFTFAQAMQHSVAVKGAGVNHNTVRQMLKNWRKQGLVVLEEDGKYRKVNG